MSKSPQENQSITTHGNGWLQLSLAAQPHHFQFPQKFIVVGDGCCGKTSWINRLRATDFHREYLPTNEPQLYRMTFIVEEGSKIFVDLLDVPGQEALRSSPEVVFAGAHAAIIMCDLSKPGTLENVKGMTSLIRGICGPIPVNFCFNKADMQDAAGNSSLFSPLLQEFSNTSISIISAKAKVNLQAPVQQLLQQLSNAPSLQLQACVPNELGAHQPLQFKPIELHEEQPSTSSDTANNVSTD